MKYLFSKKETILVVILLTISALLFLGKQLLYSNPPREVEISVDGQVIKTLNLYEDTELTVEGYHGGTNHLVIEDGKVFATEATCPDKVCVHQGTIEHTGESIVCLPNRMIARIKD